MGCGKGRREGRERLVVILRRKLKITELGDNDACINYQGVRFLSGTGNEIKASTVSEYVGRDERCGDLVSSV